MKNGTNVLLFLLLTALNASGQDKNIERYIDLYQFIAINEMERTGVPASIKLAQGILESNAGRSTLARKANNHFGIKCGSRWRGKKFHQKDDDYRNGRLVKSCFRVYRNSEQSYTAHSDFLLDNRRYGDLFKLPATDYKRWARGLKKAGYATSRTYDKKLIRIIETYDLAQYDRMSSSDRTARAEPYTRNQQQNVFYINDAKMTYALAGETPGDVARRTRTSLKRILKYNEGIRAANQFLEADEKVFIQEKRRNFRGKQRVHIVRPDETMYDISQAYGLCLDRLYKKNKMREGTQPATGESVRIRGKAKQRPRLRSADDRIPAPVPIDDEPGDRPVTSEEREPETDFRPVLTPSNPPRPRPRPEREPVLTPTQPASPSKPPVSLPEPVSRPTNDDGDGGYNPTIQTRMYHTVKPGETLWRISRLYNTSVDSLKQLNGLSDNTIRVGAKLRVL